MFEKTKIKEKEARILPFEKQQLYNDQIEDCFS